MNLRVRPLSAPQPGTGRLGVVSGILTVAGVVAAYATVKIAEATFDPDSLARLAPGRSLITLVGALSFTIGCFRTSRLLDRRRREGVVTTLILLAAPPLGYFTGNPPTAGSLGATVAGLVLVASVWGHLDR